MLHPTPRVWPARIVVLVTFLDLFMQFPVIAPYAASLGASAFLVGVTVAAYSATNLAGNVIAGVMLDRWGRKRPVFGGLAVTAVALLGYVVAQSPGQLLAARAVHGFAAAVLTPGAFAMMGDAAPPDRRARVMGVSGAFIAVAAIAGPAISGVLRDKAGFDAVFLLAAGLMLVALAVLWTAGREPGPAAVAASHEEVPPPTSLVALLTRPRLVAAYVAALALTVGLGTLVTHLPIVLSSEGYPAWRSGMAFTAFAVVAMAAMASPANRLSDRYGRHWPMAGGFALVCAGLMLLWALGGFSGHVLGMGVFGAGFGLLFPAATALVAEASGPTERGRAFGIFYAVYSLGVVIGSLASGLLSEQLGESSRAPFLASAAVALVTVVAIPALRLRLSRPAS